MIKNSLNGNSLICYIIVAFILLNQALYVYKLMQQPICINDNYQTINDKSYSYCESHNNTKCFKLKKSIEYNYNKYVKAIIFILVIISFGYFILYHKNGIKCYLIILVPLGYIILIVIYNIICVTTFMINSIIFMITDFAHIDNYRIFYIYHVCILINIMIFIRHNYKNRTIYCIKVCILFAIIYISQVIITEITYRIYGFKEVCLIVLDDAKMDSPGIYSYFYNTMIFILTLFAFLYIMNKLTKFVCARFKIKNN